MQNELGSSEYGMYFSLFNLSILFNIILDLGLTNFNNRNIAQHKQLLPKYFSNIVVLKFLLSVVYMAITISVGLIAGYDFTQFKILFLLIANQFLLSFILYLRSNISGLHYFKTDSLISILDRVLLIVFITIMLKTSYFKEKFNITWFVFGQTLAYLITATIAFFTVLYHAKKIRIKFNKAFLFSTLRQTFPYALLVFLMSLHNRFDSFILERLLPDGKVQVGIYAQSYRILDAISQFSLLFAGLLLPIFSKMLKQKENVNELVNFSFFLLLTPAVIFVISSIFYGQEIISALYTEHQQASAKVFVILITVFIPISTAYIFGTLLTANGDLKRLNIIAFIGVVINLTMNLLLIPKIKTTGAAITALTTQSVTAILQLILAFRLFKINISLKQIISILLFLMVFVVSVLIIHKQVSSWFIGYLVCLFVGVVLGVAFKLLNIKLLFGLLKGVED